MAEPCLTQLSGDFLPDRDLVGCSGTSGATTPGKRNSFRGALVTDVAAKPVIPVPSLGLTHAVFCSLQISQQLDPIVLNHRNPLRRTAPAIKPAGKIQQAMTPQSIVPETDLAADDGPAPATRAAPDRAARVALIAGRARDAALAMQEYQAEKLAVLANTERLRTLRLMRESAAVSQGKTTAPVKKDL